MIKYIYKVNEKETTRKEFVKYVAEKCEYSIVKLTEDVEAIYPHYDKARKVADYLRSVARKSKHESTMVYMGGRGHVSVKPIEY